MTAQTELGQTIDAGVLKEHVHQLAGEIWERNVFHPAALAAVTFYCYQHYHSASDTPDKISYLRFTQAVIGLHNTFSRIAASGLQV